jgi:hypothetical protein
LVGEDAIEEFLIETSNALDDCPGGCSRKGGLSSFYEDTSMHNSCTKSVENAPKRRSEWK